MLLKKTLSADSGFSLLEVMIAIVILSVILLTLVNAFVSGSKIGSYKDRKNKALRIAERIMEEIKSSPNLEIDLSRDYKQQIFETNLNNIISNVTLTSDEADQGYEFDISTKSCGQALLKKIKVTVKCPSPDESKEVEVELKSLVAPRRG